MIGTGKFRACINDAERLFRKARLPSERVAKPDYTKYVGTIRNLPYADQWEYLYRQRLYDLKLPDSSLIQFRESPFSYSYMECPYEDFSFEEFARDSLQGGQIVSVELRAEYDNVVSSFEPKPTTPIRFDYDVDAYRPGLHPAAHVHMGFRSNIRIATERFLTPISFACLILRQCYPHHWEILLRSNDLEKSRGDIRSALTKIPGLYRQAHDHDELYLA